MQNQVHLLVSLEAHIGKEDLLRSVLKDLC